MNPVRHLIVSFAAAALLPLMLIGADSSSTRPSSQPSTQPTFQPTDPKLLGSVEALGSIDPAKRESAENELANAGRRAVALLEVAVTDSRPEVAARARRALRRIRLFQLSHVPDNALQLADVYLHEHDASRRALLLDRLQLVSPSADEVVLRLFSLESDESLHDVIRDRLRHRYRERVAGLIADGDADALLPFLETSARKEAADKSDHSAEADYAAFLSLTGRLDEEIERWTAELKNTAPTNLPAASILCYLYRVSGRSDEALAMARRAGEPTLIFLVLQDQGAWDAAAREPDDRWPDPVIAAGLRAGFQRLAGHTGEAAGALSSFFALPPDADQNLTPSKVFLLNDQPVRGIDSMTEQHPAAAARMYWNRGDYAKAIEISEKYASHSSDEKELASVHEGLKRLLGLAPPVSSASAEVSKDPTTLAFEQAVADLKSRDFTKAAGEFAALWATDRSQADRLYLQGYATDAAGDHEAGRRSMQQAMLIPLGDPLKRWQMSVQLDAAGLNAEAEAQRALALRTGAAFDEIGFSEVFNTRALAAIEHKQWQEAADMIERLCLINLSPNVLWHDPTRYLSVPALARLNRARQLRDHHDLPAAMTALAAFQNYFPADMEMAIEWTTALDDMNEHTLADTVFKDVYGKIEPLSVKYPRSAAFHNQLAWLGACCGRKLDAAIENAESAVRLEPKNWQYLDTLAEIHFRRGERQGAINLEKQTATMSNDAAYCDRQLKRFSSAAVPSTTQPGPEPQ